jgi:heat-inducible transcriptional repressor
VVDWERRRIAQEIDEATADASLHVASELLSERTGQLGFAVLPRLDRVVLRHVSLIRVSSERVLVVLVSRAGATYQRFIHDTHSGGQIRLEGIESELNRRLAGHTLAELRELLQSQTQALRDRASRLALHALLAAVSSLSSEAAVHGDVLIATRAPLMEQPEFHDPERLRALLAALETHETLVAFVDRVLDQPGVAVTFGGEVEVPELSYCAVVSASCGAGEEPLGMVGVLGPNRMDYARVIPLVGLFSRLVTEKLRQ